MFIPHFDVFCDLLLNRHMATWNTFVLYNNKETNCYSFFHFSFAINRKPAFAHFGALEKKSFDVIYCLYKMQQSHWLLCIARNCDWCKKSCHSQTWLKTRFLWNENLQRKQNWTATSTSFKENTGKVKSVFAIKAALWAEKLAKMDVALKVAGIEKIHSENLRLWSIWRPINLSFEWKEL